MTLPTQANWYVTSLNNLLKTQGVLEIKQSGIQGIFYWPVVYFIGDLLAF